MSVPSRRQRVLQYGRDAVARPENAVLADHVTVPAKEKMRVAERVSIECAIFGTLRDSSYFVPEIPGIMRKLGLKTAARFQERWLRGAANQLVGRAQDGRGSKHPLAVEPVDIDWVLSFSRARKLMSKLTSHRVFLHPASRVIIKDRLAKRFAETGAREVPLSDPAKTGRNLELEYVNHRGLGRYAAFSLKIDDLLAAFGRFTLYVIPVGRARKNGDWVETSINSLAIYARDSFDFNGSDSLGWWRKEYKHQHAYVQPLSPRSEAGKYRRRARCLDEWFPMSDNDYRRYRDRTKRGEDFLVYSTVKHVKISTVRWTYKDKA